LVIYKACLRFVCQVPFIQLQKSLNIEHVDLVLSLKYHELFYCTCYCECIFDPQQNVCWSWVKVLGALDQSQHMPRITHCIPRLVVPQKFARKRDGELKQFFPKELLTASCIYVLYFLFVSRKNSRERRLHSKVSPVIIEVPVMEKLFVT